MSDEDGCREGVHTYCQWGGRKCGKEKINIFSATSDMAKGFASESCPLTELKEYFYVTV